MVKSSTELITLEAVSLNIVDISKPACARAFAVHVLDKFLVPPYFLKT